MERGPEPARGIRGDAMLYSVALALLAIGAALVAFVALVLAMIGRLSPLDTSIVSMVAGPVAFAAWYGHRVAEARDSRESREEAGLRESLFPLEGKRMDRWALDGAVRIASLPEGLEFCHPRAPLLGFLGMFVGQVVPQLLVHLSTGLMPLAIAGWVLAFWGMAPVTYRYPWETVRAVHSGGRRFLFVLDGVRGIDAYSLRGYTSVAQRLLARLETRVPILPLQAPAPGSRPSRFGATPPPRTAIDARKQKELEETLARLSKM